MDYCKFNWVASSIADVALDMVSVLEAIYLVSTAGIQLLV
jgi:hypothetical protein